MDIFDYRKTLIDHYAEYISGFIKIRDQRISSSLQDTLTSGHLWPESLIQLNPCFKPGPLTDTDGNFIPMSEWDSNNWPSHIRRPKES
jgi:hypothetical protein